MNRFLQTPAASQAFCRTICQAPLVAFDTETQGLDWRIHKCLGISFAKDSKDGTFFFLPPPQRRKELLQLLVGPAPKLAFNAKFDLHALREAGFEVGGQIIDVYIMSKLWNERRENHKLKSLAAELFEPGAADEQDALKVWLEARGKTFSDLESAPAELLAMYGANDPRITFGLYEVLLNKLEEAKIPWSLVELESRVQRIAFEMEHRGVCIDKAFLTRYSRVLAGQQEVQLKKIQSFVDDPDTFNPESGDQVASAMAALGWKGTKQTATGKDSVDKGALEGFNHPFSTAILEHRRIGTIRATFVEGLLTRGIARPEGLVVHTTYNTAGASTGRWSSANPNLQNVDKKSEARKGIIPRKGHELWSFDFKQIEPVIFAHHTRSKRLIAMFNDGLDYHRFNASLAFGIPYDKVAPDGPERAKAKGLGLAIMYQAGAAKAAQMMGVPIDEGKRMLAAYYAELPEVKKLQRETIDTVENRAVEVAKKAGRLEIVDRKTWVYDGKTLGIRKVPKGNGEFWEFVDKSAVEEFGWIRNTFGRRMLLKIDEAYKALNRLIQSDAGDLLKEALVRVPVCPLLQVHDELVFELPAAKAKATAIQIKDAMESVRTFFPDVPVRVDVARSTTNWGMEKAVKL